METNSIIFHDSHSEKSHSVIHECKKNRWALLRNVIRAIALFKIQQVDEANDITQLIDEIKHIPTDPEYRRIHHIVRENSAYHIAIQDLRREQNLLQCVERGNPDDLIKISTEIENDPYRKLRNVSHPLSLINKRNRDGQTPLYIACKNGNLEVVLLLLSNDVDYLLTSTVGNEEETALEVALRWGYRRIVQELLKKRWPKAVLAKARTICTIPEMSTYFGKKHKKSNFWCCGNSN